MLEDDIAAGDIVVLDGGKYTLDNASGDIDIRAAATIRGNGAKIRQTLVNERVLDTEDDLTLQNVTITGGRENSSGGGVRIDDSSATLTVRVPRSLTTPPSPASMTAAGSRPTVRCWCGTRRSATTRPRTTVAGSTARRT